MEVMKRTMRQRMSGKTLHSGFTLIEVLVVIAVIAVALGMLIPSFMYVRKQANLSSMQVQMKRIQQAMDQYISEYNEAPGVYTHVELKDVHTDITQTENIFFSLMGGVVYDADGKPADINSLALDVREEDGGDSYDAATFGTGSVYRDDSGSSSRQGSFYKAGKREIRTVTGTTGSDNYIPDIVDPVNGQPIVIYTPARYPRDLEGYGVHLKYVVPVAYDNTMIGDDKDKHGLIWRRLNDDFISAEALDGGAGAINQKMNSLISDACIQEIDPAMGRDSITGANSNLAWWVMNWTNVGGGRYYAGNPNSIPKYGSHQVNKGYFLISAGYDGVYFNKESNLSDKVDRKYHHGHWSWESGYTQYSTFLEEREHWFEKKNKRLVFAHRYYDGTEVGESIKGRDGDFNADGLTGGSDGAYGRRNMEALKNFDDIVLTGGELDGSLGELGDSSRVE